MMLKKNQSISLRVNCRVIEDLNFTVTTQRNLKAGKFIGNRLKGQWLDIPVSFSVKIASRSDTIASPAVGL